MNTLKISTTVHSINELKELLSQLAALKNSSEVTLTCDLILDESDLSSPQ